MTRFFIKHCRRKLPAFLCLLAITAPGQLSMSSGTYSQNFDTLASTGTGIA